MVSDIRRGLTGLLVSLVLFSAGCQQAAWPPGASREPAPTQPQLEKVSMNLGWVLWGMYAPFYYGVDRGYFRQEGIDLEMHEGKGAAVTAQTLAAGGGGDIFASVDYGTLMVTVDKGLGLKAIYGILQYSPQGIVALEDSGIRTLKDLEGRRVAFAPGDAQSQIFPVLMRLNKLDETKVEVVTTEPAGKLVSVLTKKLDAATIFDITERPIIEAQGAKVNIMLFADYGVNLLSNGLIVSDSVLRQNRELVRRFVRATHRSWVEAVTPAKQEEAVTAMVRMNPEVQDKKPLFLRQLALTSERLHTEASKGKPIGWTAREDWENAQRILLEAGQIRDAVPIDTYYTNEFIPQ
jgi:NitT/TauT family transport system substrate-binding protein